MRLKNTDNPSEISGLIDNISEENFLIRKMRMDDIDDVVNIHILAFQNFFLSFLGRQFLRELYSALVKDPSGIALINELDGKPIGFAAGTDQPAGFYKRLIRSRWWRFVLASIGPILKKPAIIPRLLRALKKPLDSTTDDMTGELMSVATLPKKQGKGAGLVLLEAYLNESAKSGLKTVMLTTDHDNNERVNKIYKKFGFICSRTFITHEGRKMNEYVYNLENLVHE